MKNKAIIISILAIVMSLFMGVVAAQDDSTTEGNRPGRGHGLLEDVMELVTGATGLTPQEVMEQLRDGATLTQLIEDAGGDASAVITDVQAEVNNRIEELFTTEFDFTGRNPGSIRDRVQSGVIGELASAVTEATGLELMDIMQQLGDGATVAEIITENGGDVDVVITSVIDSVTTALNERVESGELSQENADIILETLEETVTNWVNGDTAFPSGHRSNPGNGRGNN